MKEDAKDILSGIIVICLTLAISYELFYWIAFAVRKGWEAAGQ